MVPEERAEEYALMLQEIMERIGRELLAPLPVKAEVRFWIAWRNERRPEAGHLSQGQINRAASFSIMEI